MTPEIPDIIDQLVGITPGSALDRIRETRPAARANAQASYLALFAPAEPGAMPLVERFAVAAFVAGLHRQPVETEFYAAQLAKLAPDLAPLIAAEVAAGLAEGPSGSFPPGPLSAWDSPAPAFSLGDNATVHLGPRLAAALQHAHLLVFHPRDADPDRLRHLLGAGWSTDGIVTLSQLVAFLAFQLRVTLGLRALAAATPAAA